MRIRDALGWLSRPRYGIIHLLLFAVVVGVIIGWQYTHHRNQLYATVLQSPLANVRVADQGEVPNSVATRGKYDFTSDWFSWNIPVWRKVLSPYQGKAGVRYLEIGAYEGRSAVWMLENVLTHPTARLMAIDIFDGPYERRYHANIERSGSVGKTTTIKGPSQVEARKLPLESFDIIYIDGSHSKDDVLEDAVLSWRLLAPGGLLIFDDYCWVGSFTPGNASDSPNDFPKAAIDAFAGCFEKQFTVVHNGYQLILRKGSAVR